MGASLSDKWGQNRTYSLSGDDASAFAIDTNSGQISVAAGTDLDYETKSSYSVTASFKLTNPNRDVGHAVTINVVDITPPAKPDAPTVARSSTSPKTALDISWTAPDNGGSSITNYYVQYIKEGADRRAISSWTTHTVTGTSTSTTLNNLDPATTYHVHVKAENVEGTGAWSDAGTGSTNRPPVFGDGDSTTRSVAENSAAGTNVGDAVTATDADGDALTYSLSGSSAFTIDSGSGQIAVASGATLDYETTSSYSVTVTANDGKGDTEAIAVTINVTDVDEPPGKPDAPTVTRSSTSPKTALDVSWTAPTNTGPAITDYDVQYRKQGAEGWTNLAFTGTGTSTSISSLAAATTYEVQVRANNVEGVGAWSDSGTGITNRPPVFGDGDSTTRSVVENSAAGTNVGDAVTATDADSDALTYSLSGSSAFTIDSGSGQIKVASGAVLDYETTSSYSVTVTANDGKGDTDAIAVTISVTDGDERPGKPDAPTVTRSSTSPKTALDISWTAPTNTGPAITDYDVQYRKQGAEGWTAHSFTGTGTSTSISSLESATTYEVQVRASNADGAGAWSDSGTGSTNRSPVFTEGNPNAPGGRETSREVAENSPAGTLVGTPVAATDADGDALTYSLSGSSAFTIDSGSGQIAVASGATLDYETTSSYSVTVTVSDGKDDTDNIAVNIDVTDVDEPPGKPDAPTVTRSSTSPNTALDISWTAPANGGGPAISDYDVQYRKQSASAWTSHSFTGTGTQTTISTLSSETTYEVVVLASNAEGSGDWSDEGTGGTNRSPTFTDAVDFQRYRQGTAITPLVFPEATGGDGSLTYALMPPAGLAYTSPANGESNGGVMDGTPTEPKGKTRYDLTATDEDGDEATASFFVVVTENLLPAFADAVDDKIWIKNEQIRGVHASGCEWWGWHFVL